MASMDPLGVLAVPRLCMEYYIHLSLGGGGSKYNDPLRLSDIVFVDLKNQLVGTNILSASVATGVLGLGKQRLALRIQKAAEPRTALVSGLCRGITSRGIKSTACTESSFNLTSGWVPLCLVGLLSKRCG